MEIIELPVNSTKEISIKTYRFNSFDRVPDNRMIDVFG